MLAKEVLTEEWLADVLQDSLDMDWTTTDGARAIIQALERGLVELPQMGGQITALTPKAPPQTPPDAVPGEIPTSLDPSTHSRLPRE